MLSVSWWKTSHQGSTKTIKKLLKFQALLENMTMDKAIILSWVCRKLKEIHVRVHMVMFTYQIQFINSHHIRFF